MSINGTLAFVILWIGGATARSGRPRSMRARSQPEAVSADPGNDRLSGRWLAPPALRPGDGPHHLFRP